MSNQFSNLNRELINSALRSNLNSLYFWGGEILSPTVFDTVREMVAVTNSPYDQTNIDFVGDTLDRHSWSCVGNLAELVVLMTYAVLMGPGVFLRSFDDQVNTKADIAIGLLTYQVKSVTYGSGGQMFVAEAELDGTADRMVYVDSYNRRLISFPRGSFRHNMRDVMDVGGPYDRWYNKAGWFITPEHCSFVEITPIPVGVVTAYYDADEQQIYLNDGVEYAQ